MPVGVVALQLVVTLNPGNRMDVLPAIGGRLLVRVTLTTCPSVTIRVGPGTCIVPQVDTPWNEAGENVAAVPALQPYPQE